MLRCFRVNGQDNVATMLDDGEGMVKVLGEKPEHVQLLERIQLGHKVALQSIPADGPIIKFGVAIGRTTRNIRAGEWVHLHNCASNFDERSQTFDVNSGATTDTKYE